MSGVCGFCACMELKQRAESDLDDENVERILSVRSSETIDFWQMKGRLVGVIRDLLLRWYFYDSVV